jgi:succinoglycan biosynthesis transport protein ExoP
MSVEFRQRKASEYAKIVWGRKWMVLLPAIAVFFAVAIVVWRLPSIYESTTMLIVRPPSIPNAVVPALSDNDLSLRLNNINQIVLSRSSLEPLITKYDLFQRERSNGEAMEMLVDQMRKDISVDIDHGRNDNVPAFRVSFRGNDPRITQSVTAEIASKYVNAQTEDATREGRNTIEFFDQQLEEAKGKLDEIDKRRLDFMQKNLGHLPTEAGSLIAQLTGLREQQKALISEIGRLQDRRSALSNQVTLMTKQTEQDVLNVAENTTDPKLTPAYAELLKRKSELEAEVQDMLSTLKPKNPDVVKKQVQLDSVKHEMDQMNAEWKARIEEKRKKLSDRVNLPVAGYETEMKLTEGEINRQQKLLAETESQIAELSSRIDHVPGAEVGLGSLDREYQTQKMYYDSLLEKKQKASLAAEVATKQQGETIQVIDPANMPTKPVAPKRMLLTGGGLGLGLALGLLLAAIFEIPKLFTIQTSEDAAHYSGVPVLATLPDLWTADEARMIPIRRTAYLVAGTAATFISIPALALLLRATRVFEKFLS